MGSTQSIGELLNNVTMNNVVKQSLTNNEQCNNVGMWKSATNPVEKYMKKV